MIAKGDKFRPHGHLGAKSTRLAADRAVLKTHFGPYYKFVQRLGGIPVIYFIIGVIIGKTDGWGMGILYGIGGAVYALLFQIYAVSYFAMRSKIGLEICPKGTFGHFWSKIFIPRAIFDHLVMMGLLVFNERLPGGIMWFLLSGVVLYFIDYAITLSSTLKYSLKEKGSSGGKKDRKTGGKIK